MTGHNEKHFRYLSPQRVRELSTPRPQRVILDTARCWLLIAASWWFVAADPSFWRVCLAVPVIGTQFYGLFILGHDAMHRRLFANRRWNDRYADLLIYGPIGCITRINNHNHLLHHWHLASASDPDRHKYICINKNTPLQLAEYLSGLRSIYPTFTNIYHIKSATSPANKKHPPYTKTDLIILLGWQLTLMTGLSWAVGFWGYPILWLLPVYLFTYLGDNFRTFTEHSQTQEDSQADQHRLISYLPGPLERIFFSPMYMNYHIAHHLWPSIPYFNLPVADRELRAAIAADPTAANNTLEWRTSYLKYLWKYLRALPIPGCSEKTNPVSA